MGRGGWGRYTTIIPNCLLFDGLKRTFTKVSFSFFLHATAWNGKSWRASCALQPVRVPQGMRQGSVLYLSHPIGHGGRQQGVPHPPTQPPPLLRHLQARIGTLYWYTGLSKWISSSREIENRAKDGHPSCLTLCWYQLMEGEWRGRCLGGCETAFVCK